MILVKFPAGDGSKGFPFLPTVTFPNKPSKTYQRTQGSRQTEVTSGDLCEGEFLCPEAFHGLQRAKGQ